MGNSKILFFLFSFFSLVCGNENVCPNSYCSTFSLHHPFKVQSLQPPNSCTYINLTCIDTQSNIGITPMLSLPYGGDFYVRYIGYYESHVALYDPGKCLMRRLMNLNLSSSPLKAISYENYTFYTCPANASVLNYYVLPIDCLSNSTYSTVATALISPALMLQDRCEVVGSWRLPVLEKEQFEFDGINGDLYLKWDEIPCKACEGTDYYVDKPGESKDSLWTKFAKSALFIPSFVVLATFLIIFFLQIIKLITERQEPADVQPESDTAATALPRPPAGGLDDSKIGSCTRLLVITENRINVGPDFNTCSICLESYVTQDTVRSIAKCDHCFHADCIELWLRKNSTCPVCRTVLSDVVQL